MMMSLSPLPAPLSAMALPDMPAISVDQIAANASLNFQNLIELQKCQPITVKSVGVQTDMSEPQFTAPQNLSEGLTACTEMQAMSHLLSFPGNTMAEFEGPANKHECVPLENVEPENETANKLEPDPLSLSTIGAITLRTIRPANIYMPSAISTPKPIDTDILGQSGAPENSVSDIPIHKAIVPFPALNAPISSEFETAPVNQTFALPAINLQQNFADRQLDLARDALWLGQLANDIVAARDITDRLTFRLVPENLGRMDVDLKSLDTGLHMQIKANNEDAAKLVAAAQPRLVEELRAQGIRVNATEVTHGELAQNGKSTHHQAASKYPEITEYRDTEIEEIERPAASGRFA
jgi:hypothetical protein